MLELRRFLICIVLLMLTSCTGRPDNVFPVTDFSIDNYLGVWYEIARTDNKFERGLINVTATYSAQSDGGIKVVNRGYDQNSGEMREAEGQAYFVGRASDGHLKVSLVNLIEPLFREDIKYTQKIVPRAIHLNI